MSFPGSLCVCVSSDLCEYVCMCVNMCVCIWGVYVCVYVGVNICVYMCVYMVHIHVQIYMNVYIHACVHISVCVWYVYICICVLSVCVYGGCVFTCMCIHFHVCVRAYARMHVHTRVCVYAYVCMRVHVCVCVCTEQLTAETPFSSFPTRGKIKWTLVSLLDPRSYNPSGECCGLHSYSLFFSGRLCQMNKKQIHSACAKIKKGKKGILQLRR